MMQNAGSHDADGRASSSGRGKPVALRDWEATLRRTLSVLVVALGAGACGSSDHAGAFDAGHAADDGGPTSRRDAAREAGCNAKAGCKGDAANGGDRATSPADAASEAHDARVSDEGATDGQASMDDGPASDPFPRAYLLAIGGDVEDLNTAAFRSVVQYYNAVEVGTYLGAEQGIGATYPAMFSSWKSLATTKGGHLRALIYTIGFGIWPVGQGSFPWLVDAVSAAHMYLYDTYPPGSPVYLANQPSSGIIQTQLSSAGTNLTVTAPLTGMSFWQTYNQYFYDVLVQGLAQTKYSEHLGLAANPSCDGLKYDQQTPYPYSAGAWDQQDTTSYPAWTTNYAYPAIVASVQQGQAKYSTTLKAIDPHMLVVGNTNYGYFNADITLDPSNVGIYDYAYAEGQIGDAFAAENYGTATLMSRMTAGEAQMSSIGTMVLGQNGLPNNGGFPTLPQSGWTSADWQGYRYGFAFSQMRNWHWGPTNNDYDANAVLMFDELYQGGTTGWLSAGKQRLDPPQSAAWSNGVWRRRFPNGWILANPRGNGVQTVTVPTTLSRIVARGFSDAAVNTGDVVTSGKVTLQDGDGLFLIGSG